MNVRTAETGWVGRLLRASAVLRAAAIPGRDSMSVPSRSKMMWVCMSGQAFVRGHFRVKVGGLAITRCYFMGVGLRRIWLVSMKLAN